MGHHHVAGLVGARRGTLEWSSFGPPTHTIDCVYAPAFFLASHRRDAYPAAGGDLTLGEMATPLLLVESLHIATRIVAGVVRDTPPDVRSIIFLRPEAQSADRLTSCPAALKASAPRPRRVLGPRCHVHDAGPVRRAPA